MSRKCRSITLRTSTSATRISSTASIRGRVLTIDVDELDYEHEPKDFGFITDKIDRVLFGLF